MSFYDGLGRDPDLVCRTEDMSEVERLTLDLESAQAASAAAWKSLCAADEKVEALEAEIERLKRENAKLTYQLKDGMEAERRRTQLMHPQPRKKSAYA